MAAHIACQRLDDRHDIRFGGVQRHVDMHGEDSALRRIWNVPRVEVEEICDAARGWIAPHSYYTQREGLLCGGNDPSLLGRVFGLDLLACWPVGACSVRLASE